MANKKLFPNAEPLPPKQPKIKGSKWKKGSTPVTNDAPQADSTPVEKATPADEATTVAAETTPAEPVVVSMSAAEARKAKPKGKKASKSKATKDAKPKKEGMSMTEAAGKVLAEKGEAMSCRDMIDVMAKAGYWKSPGGLTPHNTLYSAILRLIQKDGKSATFKKTDRGMFTLNASARA